MSSRKLPATHRVVCVACCRVGEVPPWLGVDYGRNNPVRRTAAGVANHLSKFVLERMDDSFEAVDFREFNRWKNLAGDRLAETFTNCVEGPVRRYWIPKWLRQLAHMRWVGVSQRVAVNLALRDLGHLDAILGAYRLRGYEGAEALVMAQACEECNGAGSIHRRRGAMRAICAACRGSGLCPPRLL